MLSTADIAGMAETLEESLPDHCQLELGSVVADGSGGWIPDPAAPTQPILACRVSPLATTGRQFEDIDADKITSSVPWIATFPRGTSVKAEDRITHVESGQVFEVVGPFTGRSWEIGVRVIVRQVQ